MENTTIIGMDIAKKVFQLHGANERGAVTFRKKLSRAQLLSFLRKHRCCVVALESCATAHHGGREIEALGHTVRLIAPIYVKPFVKRQKNDVADAEAIAEAASRPTMRFVAIKTHRVDFANLGPRNPSGFYGRALDYAKELRRFIAL